MEERVFKPAQPDDGRGDVSVERAGCSDCLGEANLRTVAINLIFPDLSWLSALETKTISQYSGSMLARRALPMTCVPFDPEPDVRGVFKSPLHFCAILSGAPKNPKQCPESAPSFVVLM
jgi:hypothetical protein